jgi:hypothetical protein
MIVKKIAHQTEACKSAVTTSAFMLLLLYKSSSATSSSFRSLIQYFLSFTGLHCCTKNYKLLFFLQQETPLDFQYIIGYVIFAANVNRCYPRLSEKVSPSLRHISLSLLLLSKAVLFIYATLFFPSTSLGDLPFSCHLASKLMKTNYSFKQHDSYNSAESHIENCPQNNKAINDTRSFGLYSARHSIDSPTEQHKYSASRIAAFVDDHIDSQVLHRRSSTAVSIQEHTDQMKVYLERFEANMTRR